MTPGCMVPVPSSAASDLVRLLAAVEHTMEESVAGIVIQPVLKRHLSGGKRLRGTLVLLPSTVSSRADCTAAVGFAAAIELIHAGTLCHDDVVDRSDRRRGRPPLGVSVGEHGAALAGLLLMWRAFRLVADQPDDVRTAVARTASQVAAGQAEEMCDCWIPVSVERYVARLEAKTSSLFELAALLGWRAAGFGRESMTPVLKFANDVGLAFQLADDLRDLTGTADAGRVPGQDLREGVLTLPVLLAMADSKARPNVAAALRAAHEGGHEDAERLRTMLIRDGWLERAEAILQRYWSVAELDLDAVEPPALREILRGYLETVRGLGIGERPPARLQHFA